VPTGQGVSRDLGDDVFRLVDYQDLNKINVPEFGIPKIKWTDGYLMKCKSNC
jgi:hypothetical protein